MNRTKKSNRHGLIPGRNFVTEPKGKDPTEPRGQQKDSSFWALVFSALVVGAIGFTVWQEVEGHETQSAKREANRRFAEERERLEAQREQDE
jgi:hypothetical protein